MLNWIAIAMGGALGALARYGLSVSLQSWGAQYSKGTFALGTLLVNIIGCFLAGMVLAYKSKGYLQQEAIYLGLTFGFLGALTTFSTFTSDTLRLFLSGNPMAGALNFFVNVIVCFISIIGAYYLVIALLSDQQNTLS